MNATLLTQIIQLIVSLGPLAVQEFLKLEAVLNLGSDEKQNIANAIAAANSADQDTIDAVAAWKKANNIT